VYRGVTRYGPKCCAFFINISKVLNELFAAISAFVFVIKHMDYYWLTIYLFPLVSNFQTPSTWKVAGSNWKGCRKQGLVSWYI